MKFRYLLVVCLVVCLGGMSLGAFNVGAQESVNDPGFRLVLPNPEYGDNVSNAILNEKNESVLTLNMAVGTSICSNMISARKYPVNGFRMQINTEVLPIGATFLAGITSSPEGGLYAGKSAAIVLRKDAEDSFTYFIWKENADGFLQDGGEAAIQTVAAGEKILYSIDKNENGYLFTVETQKEEAKAAASYNVASDKLEGLSVDNNGEAYLFFTLYTFSSIESRGYRVTVEKIQEETPYGYTYKEVSQSIDKYVAASEKDLSEIENIVSAKNERNKINLALLDLLTQEDRAQLLEKINAADEKIAAAEETIGKLELCEKAISDLEKSVADLGDKDKINAAWQQFLKIDLEGLSSEDLLRLETRLNSCKELISDSVYAIINNYLEEISGADMNKYSDWKDKKGKLETYDTFVSSLPDVLSEEEKNELNAAKDALIEKFNNEVFRYVETQGDVSVEKRNWGMETVFEVGEAPDIGFDHRFFYTKPLDIRKGEACVQVMLTELETKMFGNVLTFMFLREPNKYSGQTEGLRIDVQLNNTGYFNILVHESKVDDLVTEIETGEISDPGKHETHADNSYKVNSAKGRLSISLTMGEDGYLLKINEETIVIDYLLFPEDAYRSENNDIAYFAMGTFVNSGSTNKMTLQKIGTDWFPAVAEDSSNPEDVVPDDDNKDEPLPSDEEETGCGGQINSVSVLAGMLIILGAAAIKISKKN